MSYTKAPSSIGKSKPSSGKRPPSGGSDRHKSSSKHWSRVSSSSGRHPQSSSSSGKHRSSGRSSAEQKHSSSSKPAAPAPTEASPTTAVSRPPGAAPKPGPAGTPSSPSKPTTSNAIGAGTAPSSTHTLSSAPPNDAPATTPSSATRSNGFAQGGAPPNIQPLGGSMREAPNGMYGLGAASGYGGMGGNQNGMVSGLGSMGGGQDGMGSYGSMAGGGPDGMNGMGGNPMGSMYGMGGMGSMYGMGGMGSMYGMGFGSMYGGSYHSLVDAASRRASFLNRNNLIRADVKPLNSDTNGCSGEKDAKSPDDKKDGDKKNSKGREAKPEEAKGDPKDPKAAKKEVTDKEVTYKKDSADKKPSVEAKPGDKKDTKVTKESDKMEAKDMNGEKKDGEAPVAKSDGPLKFSGTRIRSLALVCKSGKGAKVTVKGRDTVVMEDKETKLDEAILIEGSKKPVEAAALSEVRNQWVLGHNATIMIGSDATRRTQAVDFMCEYLTTCTGKLAASGEYFSIYVTMTALEGADKGRDLLKEDAAVGKLALASSPVYGPALNNMTTKEVNTKETMEAVLKEGMGRAKEGEMVCSYLVLKQCRKSSAGVMVYLSSLNVTFVGPNVEHLIGLKAKKPEEPCRLYRYSVGGGSHTMCIGFVSDDDASAAKVLDALKEMREVENTEPRSGNVKRFIEYTKKEIPKCREKVSSTTDNGKKADYETMLKRMEMMLKDAEEMEKDPKTVAPKAYV